MTADGEDRGVLNDLLAMRDEPLIEALLPYVEETSFGTSLRHPLVYQIPLILPGEANRMYEQKAEALSQAVADQNWSTVIFLHERPYRLQALLDHRDEIGDEDFAALAADVWIDSENVWQVLAEWQEILSERQGLFLDGMNEEERVVLDALPDPVPVYRGCQAEINEDGLSWTVDYDKAVWFARRFSRDAEPIVIVGTIDKCDIAGYFNRRGEKEVIALSLNAVRIVRYKSV